MKTSIHFMESVTSFLPLNLYIHSLPFGLSLDNMTITRELTLHQIIVIFIKNYLNVVLFKFTIDDIDFIDNIANLARF
jgi:hypothetical protein